MHLTCINEQCDIKADAVHMQTHERIKSLEQQLKSSTDECVAAASRLIDKYQSKLRKYKAVVRVSYSTRQYTK